MIKASRDEDEILVNIPGAINKNGLALVELPLAVKPTKEGLDIALSMIGGIHELTRVTADAEKTLKLYERPLEPLCRPLAANRNANEGSTVVFKVTRRRRRLRTEFQLNSDGTSSDPTRTEGNDGPGQRHTDDGVATDRQWTIASVGLVGMVHTQFSFNMLADAQILRREKKQGVALRLDKEELQVYHRFGERIKHQTKRGVSLTNDAKALEHVMDKLDAKWGTGKKKSKTSARPSRLRKGITGHNEVREQELMVIFKVLKVFEKKTMYYMKDLDEEFQGQAVWPLRDLVPAVAYYYVNGPWRSRWVRFGFRPEDHPEARFDQLLEFRLSSGQLRQWAMALTKAEQILAAATSDANKAGKKSDLRAKDTDAMTTATAAGDSAGAGLGENDNCDGDGVDVGDGDGDGRGGGRGGDGDKEEGTDKGKDTKDESQPFCRGGVVPEVSLSKKTKGRFASQVMLNGVSLSARNRHIIGESPFRAVQEMALVSPRLDKPNASTGWWSTEMMEKLRKMTVQAIHSCIKAKQAQASAIATAAKAAAAAGGVRKDRPSGVKAGKASGDEFGGGGNTGEAKTTARAPVVIQGGAKAGASSDTVLSTDEGKIRPSSVMSRPVHERPSLTLEEFESRRDTDALDVEIIPSQAAASGADGFGEEARGVVVVGGSGRRRLDKGVGSSSGRGAPAPAPRRDLWGRGGRGTSGRPSLKQGKKRGRDREDPGEALTAADRDEIGSSDEDSESDYVNSSDLVEDSEDDELAGDASDLDVNQQGSEAESEVHSEDDEGDDSPEAGETKGFGAEEAMDDAEDDVESVRVSSNRARQRRTPPSVH